jgi:hypothetical protein
MPTFPRVEKIWMREYICVVRERERERQSAENKPIL